MDHIAIDLGGRKSQICIRSSEGEIVEEKRVRTDALSAYLLWQREHRGKCRVIVETCAEAFAVANQALTIGHEVRVVPATLAPSLGVGARRLKTDARDARAISLASCRIDLGSVHIPSSRARELKSICGTRDNLLSSRTQQINTVRGWLRGELTAIETGTAESFTARVRYTLGELKQEIPRHIERQLKAIDALSLLIVEADKDLKEIAGKDEQCRRLMTVPGVGPVTAVRFIAAIDEISRFKTAHDLESYIGLVPGESSSSESKHRLSITKAGNAALRRTLVQAAWAAHRCRNKPPMVAWAENVSSRRGKKIAVVALARKMAGILFALWRDGSVYNGNKATMMREEILKAAA